MHLNLKTKLSLLVYAYTDFSCTNWIWHALQSGIKPARVKYLYTGEGWNFSNLVAIWNHASTLQIISRSKISQFGSLHISIKNINLRVGTSLIIYFLQSSFTHKMSKGIWIWRCSDHLQISNCFFENLWKKMLNCWPRFKISQKLMNYSYIFQFLSFLLKSDYHCAATHELSITDISTSWFSLSKIPKSQFKLFSTGTSLTSFNILSTSEIYWEQSTLLFYVCLRLLKLTACCLHSLVWLTVNCMLSLVRLMSVTNTYSSKQTKQN